MQFVPLKFGLHICVYVTGIHFNSSVWYATDIALKFSNSELKGLHIFVEKSKSKTDVQLYINKSQMGSSISVSNSKAVLENSTLLLTTVSKIKGIIYAVNSSVTLKSLLVEQFQGGGFLQASTGIIHIENSVFVNCTSELVLINIVNRSLLSIDNCTFVSNEGPLVNIEDNSIGIEKKSVFKNNRVLHNSATKVFDMVRAHMDSVILVENSYFLKNTVYRGAALAVAESIGVIQDAQFCGNTGSGQYGVVHTELNGILRMSSSTFTSNECRAVSVRNSENIVISSSWFHNNTARLQGGLFLISDEDMHRNIKPMRPNLDKVWATHHFGNNGSASILAEHWIHLYAEQATISNCTFINNSAQSGGAISAVNMSLNLEDSIFVDNSAVHPPPEAFGGALDLWFCTTNITGCLFDGNKGAHGGGVYVAGGSVKLLLSHFINNQALGETAHGGAIAVTRNRNDSDTTLFVSNTTFQRNKASVRGGAVSSDAHTTKIQASTFVQNNAYDGGAVSSHSASITGCHFESNSAKHWGGALCTEAGSYVSILNSNFTLNEAVAGGAILGDKFANLSCELCSFSRNKAGFR